MWVSMIGTDAACAVSAKTVPAAAVRRVRRFTLVLYRFAAARGGKSWSRGASKVGQAVSPAVPMATINGQHLRRTNSRVEQAFSRQRRLSSRRIFSAGSRTCRLKGLLHG